MPPGAQRGKYGQPARPGGIPELRRRHAMTTRSRAAAFCKRFDLRIPILQAPMAGSTPAALAAAAIS